MDLQNKSTVFRCQGNTDLTSAAVAAAEYGVPILPCKSAYDPHDPKAPMISRGVHSATADPETVAGIWRAAPYASIAVAAGQRSGLVSLDLDIKSGEDGPGNMAALEEKHGALPETLTVRTPSGAYQKVFTYDGGLPSSNGRLAPGVEVKADKFYFLIPPSPGYAVLVEADPAPLPGWVVELAHGPRKPSAPRAKSPTVPEGAAVDPEKFAKLYERGDISGYQSHSHADFGLVNLLITRTGGDRDEVIRRFEASALYRPPETTKKHKTYVTRTVDRALETYTPPAPAQTDAATLERLTEVEHAHIHGRTWTGNKWKGPYSLMVSLVKLARRHGASIPAGVRVPSSWRELALAAGMSLDATQRAYKRLREAGLVRRDDYGRSGPERGAFVLVSPPREVGTVEHTGGGEKVWSYCTGVARPAPFTTPRLRWTAPKHLREGGLVVRYTLRRLGKSVEQLVDTLERRGGEASWADIAAELGVRRVRDVRSRPGGPGEKLRGIGAIEETGDTVRLSCDWLEKINERRAADEEIAAYRRDVRRYDAERTTYRVEYYERSGLSPETIAARLNLSEQRVRTILKSPDATPETSKVAEKTAECAPAEPVVVNGELIHADTGEVLDAPVTAGYDPDEPVPDGPGDPAESPRSRRVGVVPESPTAAEASSKSRHFGTAEVSPTVAEPPPTAAEASSKPRRSSADGRRDPNDLWIDRQESIDEFLAMLDSEKRSGPGPGDPAGPRPAFSGPGDPNELWEPAPTKPPPPPPEPGPFQLSVWDVLNGGAAG